MPSIEPVGISHVVSSHFFTAMCENPSVAVVSQQQLLHLLHLCLQQSLNTPSSRTSIDTIHTSYEVDMVDDDHWLSLINVNIGYNKQQ